MRHVRIGELLQGDDLRERQKLLQEAILLERTARVLAQRFPDLKPLGFQVSELGRELRAEAENGTGS